MSGKLDRAMSSIMAKLEATVAGALGSDGESSLTYSPTSPPLLSPAASALKETRRRGLKFSIDNILRPEFGSPVASDTSSTSAQSNDSRLSLGSTGEPTKALVSPLALGNRAASVIGSSPPVSPSKSLTPPMTPGATGAALWPAWVYCTRYSDRPSSGPRCRKVKRKAEPTPGKEVPEEKRPRTAFSAEQLNRLKHEFQENRYLTEKRRQELAHQLGLNESQIKIWFQNKRAKMKKQTGYRNPLAFALMSQGLYNHATVPVAEEEEEKKE